MPSQINQRSRPRRARQASRGVSLVEMLAVMSASTVVIGAAVVMLATIGRADRVYDKRLNQQHAVTQLAERLRADIHAAEQVTWDEPKAILRLTAADGSVLAYAAEGERWVRRMLASGEEKAEGELSGAYALPASLAGQGRTGGSSARRAGANRVDPAGRRGARRALILDRRTDRRRRPR